MSFLVTSTALHSPEATLSRCFALLAVAKRYAVRSLSFGSTHAREPRHDAALIIHGDQLV